MKSGVTYLLIIFILTLILIQFSYGDRKCGYKKFFNKQFNECFDCHSSCKECNGTLEGNCLECFNSKNHQLCSWEKGYYCLDECSKVPKYIFESTTPSNGFNIYNINIIHVLLLLVVIVTIPFICIIIILIIIYKYNSPQRRRPELFIKNNSEVEMKSFLTNRRNEKSECLENDCTASHHEFRGTKSCNGESKKSKSEKILSFEAQNTVPKHSQQSAPLAPTAFENFEGLEHIPCNPRLMANSVPENLVIASKLSIVPESFKTEQLEWNQKVLLSSGAFGHVYKCVYKDGDKCYHVAVKQPIRPTNEPFKEEQIMAQLKDHPHIVKLITTRLDENMLLVMPLLKSSLSQYLHARTNLTLTNKIRYCQQIANGMSYLMFRQIVHCDLKASNVLVVDENLVQISDFGKSEKMGDILISKRPITGTITHTAMELLDPFLHILNSEATDVWSFGVTVWEIFNTTKQIPYADCVSPLNEIKIGEYLRAKNHLKTNFWPPRETSEALVVVESYMKRCLVHTQESRPKFDKLWYWFSTLLPEGLKLGQGSAVASSARNLF